MNYKAMILVLLVSATGCNIKQAQNQSNSAADTEALTHLKEVLWPKAYAEGDTILLNKILHESFQMVDASGTWTNKNDEMDWIKRHQTQNDSFFYEIKRLEIYENGTAVVAGTGHIFNDSLETTYQSSNILIKERSEWKAISSHVSGIKRPD